MMPNSSPTSANYRVDYATLNTFFFAWLERNNFSARKLGIAAIMVVAIATLTIWPMLPPPLGKSANENLPIWAMALGSLITGLIISGITLFVLSPMLSYCVQFAGFIFGPLSRADRYAEISPDGVRNKPDGDFQEWAQIHEVVDTRKAILIFTNRNCAIMVPKAAFSSGQAAEYFSQSAETFWKLAKASASQ